MKGILQKVDFRTGKRPGDITHGPDERGGRVRAKFDKTVFRMHCQNVEQGYEVLICNDDADLSAFEGVDGIEILANDAAIDEAADSIHDDCAVIENEIIAAEFIRQNRIDIRQAAGKSGSELASFLSSWNVPGVKCKRKKKPLSGRGLTKISEVDD